MPEETSCCASAVGDLSRVGELRRDSAKLVELRDVGFIAHGDEQEVAAFLGLADAEDLHARSGLGEFIVVMVNVLRVGENVGGADDVAEDLIRRGNYCGSGEMVHEIGEEERLGRVLSDFLGIGLVVRRATLSFNRNPRET